MKIILSRKGFDSAYGGYPSPILPLPDGKLISLAVPDPEDSDNYFNLKLDDKRTYFDLMKELKSKIRYGKEWHELTEDTKCHLDPAIYPSVKKRFENWKHCFGQMDAAQTHLSNQKVKEDDLFLFFGWFKQTELAKDGKLRFKKNAPDLHIILGYLQIGEIMHIDNETKIPDWLQGHPHTIDIRKGNPNKTNTIYIARDNLSWDKNTSGAGFFKFNEELILTKNGFTRSKWSLPDLFKKVEISYHPNPWKQKDFLNQQILVKSL